MDISIDFVCEKNRVKVMQYVHFFYSCTWYTGLNFVNTQYSKCVNTCTFKIKTLTKVNYCREFRIRAVIHIIFFYIIVHLGVTCNSLLPETFLAIQKF